VAGHLNAVKALAERVPCNHLIRPEQLHSEDGIEGILGQNALEYAQHSALWELFGSFDRWEEFALQYMNAHHSRTDRLAEKQFKNETKSALGDFITRAKAMVLGDEGLNSVLDDVVRVEDPESYLILARIRDLYVPEIMLRMHEMFLWGGENLDPAYLLCQTTNKRYFDDGFDLAAAVADSGSKLHDCFKATNQLEDYLGKIKELSILSIRPENLGTGIGTGLSG
jgi:Nuclear pore protein 84 / 107